MQIDGVVIEACKACVTAYKVVVNLEKLDRVVKGMGKPMTDYLKSDARVLTFKPLEIEKIGERKINQ